MIGPFVHLVYFMARYSFFSHLYVLFQQLATKISRFQSFNEKSKGNFFKQIKITTFSDKSLTLAILRYFGDIYDKTENYES